MFECFFDGLRMSGGYLLYSAPNLKNTYIKKIQKDKQHSFIEKAKNLEDSSLEFEIIKAKFFKRLTDNFDLDKLSKKLEAFYELDFKSYLKELKKKKVALSLTQQDEWESYFDSYKKELLDLQSQIDETDREIDRMVYELYGLSEDEVAVVEGNV